MRSALRALVAGGLGFAVSLIAACGGGSRVLSADQASALRSRLTELQSAVNHGGCTDVQNGLSQLSVEISNVANSAARANLTEGFETLQRQVSSECQTSTARSTPPRTTTTKSTTTQSTPTAATPPQTIPTATATTPTNPGTTTNPGPGSGGAGLAPGNSGNAPGHNKPTIGNGY